MKTKILHGIYFCLSALLATGCVMNEPEGVTEGEGTTTAPGVKDGVTMQIIIPGPGNNANVPNENLNVETVRFFVFKSPTGELVDKTGALTDFNYEIEDATAPSDHLKQYVLTVNTELSIPVTISQSTTYSVYAVLNEKMGGNVDNNKYTGISNNGNPYDLSGDLDKITSRQDLVQLMKQPLSYTFNAANFLPATQKDDNGNDIAFQEPAFIMYGSADCTYTPSKKEFTDPIVINNQGLDRTMAKVTIESISSVTGEDDPELTDNEKLSNSSMLIVTSMGFVNLPNQVYIEQGLYGENYIAAENLLLDGQYLTDGKTFYDREWNGKFKPSYTYWGDLKEKIGGVYYQGKGVNGTGNINYTIFPPSDEYPNSNPPSGNGQTPNDFPQDMNKSTYQINGIWRGPATLYNSADEDKIELNNGNFIDFFSNLTADQVIASGHPELTGFGYKIENTTTPDRWDLKIKSSYYIPENLNIEDGKYSALRIEITIGDPVIELPTIEEMEELCKKEWENGEIAWDDALGGFAEWIKYYENSNNKKVPFFPKEYTTKGKTYWYYVNDKIGEYVQTKPQHVEGGPVDCEESNKIQIPLPPKEPKKLQFTVAIATDENGKPAGVHRNHEYKLKIVANSTTYDVIKREFPDEEELAKSATRIFTPEELGLTIIREVKPIK